MNGLSLYSLTMMRLGPFGFGISTAAYQQLRRTTDYSWPGIERYGQFDALQYTGPGMDTITLSGVIIPEYRGGTWQLDNLRNLAATGEPQLLVSGLGMVLGYWVIDRVEEGQSVFAVAGVPRRQEFTVSLRRFS